MAGPVRCRVTHGPGTRILLWGDSHTNHYVQAPRSLDGRIHGDILVYSMTACAPVVGAPSPTRPDCRPSKKRVPATITRLRTLGVEVAVLQDPSQFLLDTPTFLAARVVDGPRPPDPVLMPTRQDPALDHALAAATACATLVPTRGGLCAGEHFLVVNRGQPMMIDAHHLSRHGARRVLAGIGRVID